MKADSGVILKREIEADIATGVRGRKIFTMNK
jgi:hypothetical protein